MDSITQDKQFGYVKAFHNGASPVDASCRAYKQDSFPGIKETYGDFCLEFNLPNEFFDVALTKEQALELANKILLSYKEEGLL